MLAKLKQKFTNSENRNVFIYMLSDLLAKGIPFLLLPIYVVYLTPAQFGSIAIFNVIVEIMIVLVVLGGNSYYRVHYFKTNNHETLLGSVLANFLISIPITLVLLMFFILFDLNPADHMAYWLYCALFIAISQSLILIFLAVFQCQQKALYIGFLNMTFAIISGGATTAFLVFDYGEESRYIAYFCASIVVMIMSVFLYKYTHKQKPKFNLQQSKLALYFGAGILPHVLSWWLRTGMDRMIIATYLSVHLVGIYSLAAQLSLIVIVFSNAVNQAFTPKIMKMLTENKYNQVISLCLKTVFGYFILCLILSLATPIIFSLFIDAKFDEAQELFPLMCAVAFFQAVVSLCSNFLYFLKKVKLMSSITFFTSVLHVLISLVVVKNYGIEGVIISSIITYLLSTLLIIYFSFVSIKNNRFTHST